MRGSARTAYGLNWKVVPSYDRAYVAELNCDQSGTVPL
jgi:hypothetical protein